MRLRIATMEFFTIVAVGIVSGCGGSKSASSPPLTVPSNQCTVPSGTSNVPVPSNCAYFGAWVNPAAGPTDPISVNGYTTTLETQIGQKLRLHMHYVDWGTPAASLSQAIPSFPDQAEIDDASAGRIPVVTWGCGNPNPMVGTASPTTDIADYNLIVATANAVKAFGKPIFIRWNWEFNIPGGNKCMGNGTDAQQQAGFIAAWQNIYNIFKAQGATNVSWIWNPNNTIVYPDPAPFYPGNAYVDWIGVDGYDKFNDNDFGTIFNAFYQEFSSYGKPFLVAETGECPNRQSNYISTAVNEIAGRSNSKNYSFPLVKGFLYFDAPGQYSCVWNFDAEGTTGFAAMGSDPYFSAVE